MPNNISSDHNIVELNFDVNTDQRQVNLKRAPYNLRKADGKLREELIGTKPSNLSRNPKEAIMEFTSWIIKAYDETIPSTYINRWREIKW